jgi:hypothetical protein
VNSGKEMRSKGATRSDIYSQPDMGCPFQLMLPVGDLPEIFQLKLLLLGPDLAAKVNGFLCFSLQVGEGL